MEYVGFGPEERRVISGDSRAIRLWDLPTGRCIKAIKPPRPVRAAAFSATGEYVATASEKVITLWLLSRRRRLKLLRGHEDLVTCLAFSPEGDRLASSSDDGTVRLWDVLQGTCLITIQEDWHWALSVAFSPDGKHLAYGDGAASVLICDPATGDLEGFLIWERIVDGWMVTPVEED